MNALEFPAMSVILITPDRYERIRKTIGHLRVQTVKDRLELIIVAPSAAGVVAEERELKAFLQFRIVEIGGVVTLPRAMAAGVRAASAPVVAFTEEHAYPDPGWGEALIKAHRGPWVAVGPIVRNANPVNCVSWADFLMSYGPWLDLTPSGVVEYLPSHNCSYKREILLSYGPQLERMLEAETVLHWDLGAKEYQLYLESAAKLSHTNFELFSSWIATQFLNGRVLAASRMGNWSPLRRLLYIFGAPLIPVVRLQRVLRYLRRSDLQRELLPDILPAIGLGLIVSGVGELIGYLFGSSDESIKQLYHLEYRRHSDMVETVLKKPQEKGHL